MSDSIYNTPAEVAANNMVEIIKKHSLGLDKRVQTYTHTEGGSN